jgi:microcystin-dependent protein
LQIKGDDLIDCDLTALQKLTPLTFARQILETFLGTIALFPFPFAPAGWLECSGQILAIDEYQTLYSLIGIQYGGDGKYAFLLPDLSNAAPAPGLKYCIAMEGIYPVRP